MFETPRTIDSATGEPNVEQLRHHGWSVNHVIGSYCLAWRGQEEMLLVWRGQNWQRLPMPSPRSDAA